MITTALAFVLTFTSPLFAKQDNLPEAALQAIERSRELFIKGKMDAALAELDKAVRLAPQHQFPYVCRAAVRFNKKDYDGAISDSGEALRLEPANALAFRLRGSAFGLKREYTHAVKDLEEAVRLNPGDAEALNGRAWIAATCPLEKLRDGRKALDYSRRACEAGGWKNSYHLGTYAAACAESGRFEEAIRWQKKVLEDEGYRKQELKQAEEMLRCFQQGKPYRESQSTVK